MQHERQKFIAAARGDKDMPAIPFKQFLRPNARIADVTIDMPEHVALMAQVFIAEGGAFTTEMIGPGEVSLCAEFEHEGELQDIACIISPNGPPITEAVEKLVQEAYEYLQKVR
jgi:hypothetical protein